MYNIPPVCKSAHVNGALDKQAVLKVGSPVGYPQDRYGSFMCPPVHRHGTAIFFFVLLRGRTPMSLLSGHKIFRVSGWFKECVV